MKKEYLPLVAISCNYTSVLKGLQPCLSFHQFCHGLSCHQSANLLSLVIKHGIYLEGNTTGQVIAEMQ